MTASPPPAHPARDIAVARDLVLARAGWPRLRDRLLAGLVHDLNGRATSLGGLAQLVAMEDDTSDVASFVAEEVRRLIDTLRLLALQVDGHPGAVAEPISPAEVLPVWVETVRRHRDLRQVRWHLDVEPGLPEMEVDTGLGQPLVLLVLAGSGADASVREDRVRLELRRDGGDVRLTVDAEGGPRDEDDHAGSSRPGPFDLGELAGMCGARLLREEGAEGVRTVLIVPPRHA